MSLFWSIRIKNNNNENKLALSSILEVKYWNVRPVGPKSLECKEVVQVQQNNKNLWKNPGSNSVQVFLRVFSSGVQEW